MIDFPIVTDRFVLIPLSATDRVTFTAYRRDPAVARFQSWTMDWSDADTDALIAAQPRQLLPQSGDWLQIALHERDRTALVGDVALHVIADQPDSYELGVTLAAAWQGVGAGREALARLTDILFRDHGAHRVIARTDARNSPAAHLFTRLGFRHEGRAVDAEWCKGEWTSVDSWAMLRDEHDEQTSPSMEPLSTRST
ncbi:GNAT family N-acetyltransferase [Curtobacterium ammoniigenes]|uniref:GNAT family N-acetyltransferase n=1 Tax=Curtobacterium ammoniigenes TaxID=395387 RepID=UPI00082F6BDA|nr:GNAT family protein [Curtobacterium ammoniigenes]